MTFFSRLLAKLKRELTQALRVRQFKKQGLMTASPNYLFLPPKVETPSVIDIGCGFEAEFAVYWIKEHGATAVIVDPTRKHVPSLTEVVKTHAPHLSHMAYAVSKADGETQFFESVDNESGSLHGDHINVDGQETRSYTVEERTIASVMKEAGMTEVEMVKVDIEGAEFELFEQFDFSVFKRTRQIFVEFHHNQISTRSTQDTKAIVAQFAAQGFTARTTDDVNYLFVNSSRL